MSVKRPDRCGICGGFRLIRAVDNHGKAYMGCAVCVVRPVDSMPTTTLQAADKAEQEGK